MSLADTLRTHTTLCEEIYEVMLEENSQLKSAGRAPTSLLLKRKRALLASLTPSIESLRAAAAERRAANPEVRAAVEKAQQTILKALLLDRENEQLLLRSTLETRRADAAPKPPASYVGKAYARSVAD